MEEWSAASYGEQWAAAYDELHARTLGSPYGDVEGEFELIFVVFSSLYALLSQAEQVRCLRNVAAHLTVEGVFVVEAFVPDPARLAQPKRMNVVDVAHDSVTLDVSTVDLARQVVESQYVELRDGARPELRPIRLRYIWPAELDLMAELAGLRLRDRWSDWRRSPFGSHSAVHVSLYERAA